LPKPIHGLLQIHRFILPEVDVNKPGRNDPCLCGSGKKFKKCCMGKQPPHAPGGHDVAAPGEPVAFLDDIDLISNRVLDLIDEGRLDEAEQVCKRLLEEFPDQPDGLKRTAAVHEARGQRKEAAAYYRKAAAFHLEADPEHGHEPAAHYLEKAKALETENGEPAPRGPTEP